jgi:hypothetical protein
MANTSLALGSSLNLRRINKSVSSLSQSVSKAQSSAAGISKSLLDSNRNKRKSLSLSSTLFRRRREATLRREREDILEAGSVVGAVRRTGKVVMSSTKGFLGRILDYLGTVLIGWAVLNLPKIIDLAQSLIGRMQKYFGILNDFVSGVTQNLLEFGQKVGEVITNISTFSFNSLKDIFDDTVGKLKDSFTKMEVETYKLIRRVTGSLSQFLNYLGYDIGDFKIPGLDALIEKLEKGGDGEDTAEASKEETKAGSGGTKYPKLAALISSGEGGLNSVNRGNAGDTPGGAKSIFGKNLTEMTVGEILQAQSQKRVFAVGMYQFIPGTLRGAVNYTKIPLDTLFDARTQNRLFDYLIDVKRPEIGAYINGRSNDRRTALQQLAREFAAVGLEYAEAGRVRGQSRYAGIGQNAASISPVKAGSTLDSMRSSRQSNRVQTTGSASDPQTITYPDGTTQTYKPGETLINFEPFKKGRETVYGSSTMASAEGSNNILIINKTRTVTKPVPVPLGGGVIMASRKYSVNSRMDQAISNLA